MKLHYLFTIFYLSLLAYTTQADTLSNLFAGSLGNACKGKAHKFVICEDNAYPANECAKNLIGKRSYRLTKKTYETAKLAGIQVSAEKGNNATCKVILKAVAKERLQKRVKRLRKKGY